MPIPQRALVRGTELAKGMLYYGVPVEDLTVEELRAALAITAKQLHETQQDAARSTRLMLDITTAGSYRS